MSGRDAYRGFEYQLQVSVWLLLEGIVDGGHAIVEPPGGEDLEFLRRRDSECDTSEIATGLEVSTKAPGVAPATRYLVQIKARGAGHWKPREIEGMIFGEGSNEPGAPRRRQWPISILSEEPSAIFLFVTDSSVSDEIATLAVDSWNFRCRGERGNEAKPRWPKRLKDTSAGIRARIGILPKHPWELVIQNTDGLLARKFRVPHSKREACRKALVDRVRAAMLGEKLAKVTREEIDNIAREHGGLPARPYPWVEPLDFPEFHRHLEQNHVLLLLGKPGVGKTTAAEMLMYEHRMRDEPFRIAEVRDPRDLRGYRSETEPVLLCVEDPFGRDQPSDHGHDWLVELERLCQHARGDLKLLITSRESFAKPHFERDAGPRLRKHIKELAEGRTPGDALLGQYLNNEKNLDPAVRDWIESRSSWVVRELTRAMSYGIFVARAANVPASERTRQRLEQIVQGAKVEELGRELEETFSKSTERELRGLAAVWLTLEAWPYSSDQEQRLKRFKEDLHELEAEALGAAEKLRRYGWLDRHREPWRMHSIYLAACLGVLKKNQSLVARVVERLMEARLQERNIDALRAMLRAVAERIQVCDAMTSKICEFATEVLRDTAQRDGVGKDFTTALTLLAAHGRKGEPIAELAKALCRKPARSTQKGWGSWGWFEWRRPCWDENDRGAVAKHPDTSAIVRAFARGGFGASRVGSWSGALQLVDFLYDLVDVSEEFDMLLESIEDYGDSVVDIVAFGAVRSKNARVEDVIGRAVGIRCPVDEWARSEYPQDADSEVAWNWFADKRSELVHPAEALIDAVLEQEARQGNPGWAMTRSEPLVFERFTERVETGREKNPEVVRQVFKACPENSRASVIEAIGRTEVLSELVSELLPGVPSRDWPGLIGSLNMREASRKRVAQAAIDAFPDLAPHERVALAHDTHDVAPELSKDLRERLESEERAALDTLSRNVDVERQAPSALIEKIVDSETNAAGAALVVLAHAGRSVEGRVNAWLELENVSRGIAALDAAARLPSATAVRFARQGLGHRRAGVRKRAVELLKDHGDESATTAILEAIHDPTPTVRIIAAEALVGRLSSHACEAIAELLDDMTDTSEAAQLGVDSDEDHEPEYGVAKAAEKARDALPEELKQAVDAIRASRKRKADDVRG